MCGGIAFACAFLIGSLLPVRAARAESEEAVKAAFLFNFARYVEWREGSFSSESAPIQICVAGNGSFEAILATAVAGRSVGKRRVEVRAITGLDGADRCQLFYFDEKSGLASDVVVSTLGQHSVFTIADGTGFAAKGGVANFVLVDQKVRFEINPKAAQRAGLKISSSLLRLAKLTGDGER